jgi:hypothetical protein
MYFFLFIILIRIDTKVVSSPNFNGSHYIFQGIMVLFVFMFSTILVEIWHLLSSLLW